jgi:lipid II:glycine glycyltransferase (peptidoglycan interpeptide bridge formation enzyme)
MIPIKHAHDKDKWDEFVLENNGHPLQLWGWGSQKAAHNWKVDRVFVDQEGQTVAAAQILLRPLPWPLKNVAYIPRGPVMGQGSKQGEVWDELRRYVKETHGSICLTMEPDTTEVEEQKDWHKSKNQILMSETVVLDLEKTEAELQADMVKKTRQYIRKSSNLKVKRVRSQEDIRKCLDIYKKTAKRAGFGLHHDEYYLDQLREMGEYVVVFATYVDNEPVAFLWLAISEEVAFELYGGVTPEGQDLRANYCLKWHAISKCKEWGIARYDFNGLLGEGVSNFKKGWAESETNLTGTFDAPLSPLYGVWTYVLPFGKKVIQSGARFVKSFKPKKS